MEETDGRHGCQERTLRFLFTLNMPSAKGRDVHQIIGEYAADSCTQMCGVLNRLDFIHVRQFYKETDKTSGEILWEDKGEIILNTSQIGKIQVYIERESNHDKSYRNTQHSRQNIEGSQYPIRLGRNVFRQD